MKKRFVGIMVGVMVMSSVLSLVGCGSKNDSEVSAGTVTEENRQSAESSETIESTESEESPESTESTSSSDREEAISKESQEASEESSAEEKPSVPEKVNILEEGEENGGGMYLWNEDFEDKNGNLYSSGNDYILTQGDGPQNYISVDLDGKYSSMTGDICLLKYYNGESTMVFQVMGDDEVLCEKKFPEVGEPVNYDAISLGDISLLGVKTLKIRFFSANDQDWDTIGEAGLIDFVATTAADDELKDVVVEPKEESNLVDYFTIAKSGHGSFYNTAVTTADGVLHDSGHTYYTEAVANTNNMSADIVGKYSRLTGSIALLTHFNGKKDTVFQIIGDDQVLFEQTFTYGNLDQETIPVDIDLTGVQKLEVKYITTGTTISKIGLMDFMMTPAA